MPILGITASGGLAPGAPTIGTATDGGTGTSASVAFTAPTWPGKGSGTVTYTATSSPGGFTGTSTSSPTTVSGLTTGTAYTFTVKATTSYGVTGPSSAASNSVTPANPIAPAFDSIATVTVTGSPAAYIEFTSIPGTYKSLQIRSTQRASAGTGNYQDLSYMTFNDVSTGSLYSYGYNYATGTGAIGIDAPINQNYIICCDTPRSGTAYDIFGFGITEIFDYANTNKFKSVQWTAGSALPGTQGRGACLTGSGLYRSTSAVTKIRITALQTAFTTGSSFALYGIKG